LGLALIEPISVHGQTGGKTRLFLEGGRDPFLLPPGVRPLSLDGGGSIRKANTAPVKKEIEEFQRSPERPKEAYPFALKAILIGEGIRLAAIDQRIVTLGDSVLDEKILEIHPDRVVLGKGEKRRTLFLAQSPVRLWVKEPKPGEAP
jgi:hypothetical protein